MFFFISLTSSWPPDPWLLLHSASEHGQATQTRGCGGTRGGTTSGHQQELQSGWQHEWGELQDFMIEGWFCVFFLGDRVRNSPDTINLCPNWLLMMWNILAEQHHLTEILLTCPLSGEGGGLWVLDTAWSCHQTDHNQGSARGPLQYVIKRAASALDHCFPEWSQQSKFTYHISFSL